MEKLKAQLKYIAVNKTIIDQEKRLFDFLTETKSNLDEIKSLIKSGVDINCINQVGLTPLLHLLATNPNEKENFTEIIGFFIEHGADVNVKDMSVGYSALHYLFWKYQNNNLIDLVRLFIQHGIDLDSKDSHGSTALLFLCRYYDKDNLIDIIRLLIQKGVDINAKGKDGWSALLILCAVYQKENLIDIIRLFLENKVEINSKTKDGWNALHYLCRNYQKTNLIDLIRLLIQHDKVDIISDSHDARSIIRTYYTNENATEILQFLDEKLLT